MTFAAYGGKLTRAKVNRMTKRTISTVAINLVKLTKWILVTASLSLASVVHAQRATSDHYFLYDMFAEGVVI
ncbi:MAG: hypothetical protein ACJA13_002979 [Paraglaciecola sp.]|jgi:hypothetical protein